MDARSLQELWNGPSPFLAQMGEQEFNLNQQKRQADLATTLGMEQRNQAMHPLDMASKQASTKLNESTAGLNQYALDTKLPKDKALEQVMQKFHKETDDVSREQTKAQITRMMQIAAMAKANKGALPEGLNLKPEEIQQYAPANLDKLIQYGETFLRYDPTEIAARQRAAEAQSLAKIRTDGQIAVKTTPSAGGGKNNPTMAPPKMNLEQQMGFYNNLAFAEKDEEKKKAYQAEADRLELMIYRKAIEAQKARQAGDPNLADPKLGGLPVNPMPTPQPTPRGGSALPNGVTKSGW